MRTILLGMNKVELKGTKVINSDYEVVHQIMGLFDIEELQTFIDNESDLRADIKQHLKNCWLLLKLFPFIPNLPLLI